MVHKFLQQNQMSHILRAHQLCMEGYTTLFDKHLSTVWSAPNYCYRCGNQASILEVGPGGTMYFNVFDAAPENEKDGPAQQAQQNASGRVRLPAAAKLHFCSQRCFPATGILPVVSHNPCVPVSANIPMLCFTINLCSTNSRAGYRS